MKNGGPSSKEAGRQICEAVGACKSIVWPSAKAVEVVAELVSLNGLLLPRRMQATSARDSQTRPVRKIAGMQHWRGPPGRPEHPCPPHSPHVALQQT